MTFVISKLLWFIAAPGNFLLLLLVAGVLRAIASGRRRGFVLIATATLGFLAIATLPIGAWLAAPLEDRFPTISAVPGIDGIVVLGGSVDQGLSLAHGQVALTAAAGRITETVALARRFPAARVVISGGDGTLSPGTLSEAGAIRDLLIQLGVAPARVDIESISRNTYENAVLSYATAQPKPGETWLLVTSAMHMPRAIGCFRSAGWTIVPYPVDYRTSKRIATTPGLLLADNLMLVNLATKEWLGLFAYYWLGRSDALLPAPG
ncbi:MAG TPA: YdcF family protein [Stellaceae bacterium]|nr:YdcF family protein [Stellaceae bacterium]